MTKRERIRAFSTGECGYCGVVISFIPGNPEIVGHIIPKQKGGSDDEDNLILCCGPCHAKKGVKTPAEFKVAIRDAAFRHLDRLGVLVANYGGEEEVDHFQDLLNDLVNLVVEWEPSFKFIVTGPTISNGE